MSTGKPKEKIKKKPSWSLYKEPPRPKPPCKPTQFFTREECSQVQVGDGINYAVKLSEVKLPEGLTLQDITVEVTSYDYDDVGLKFSFYRTVKKQNPNYQKELIQYQKQYEKYLSAKKNHAKQIELWKAWKKQSKR